MGLHPFNGHEIAIELTAAADIAAYTLVTFHATDKTKVIPATAALTPIGVAIPPEESMMPDGLGGITPRTGWKAGEKPTIYDSGTLFVKVADPVEETDLVVPTTGGLGTKPAAAEIIVTEATVTAINAALAARDKAIGRYLKAGQANDIVPVKIIK